MDAIDPQLMSRIQKIKALAERAGTPAEAQAASAQLTKLLLKHNIELNQIQDENERGIVTDRRKVKLRDQWRKDLLFYVGNANLVRVVYWSGLGEAAFIGRKENVAVTIDIVNWLMAEAEKQGAAALKDAKHRPVMPEDPGTDSLSAYFRWEREVEVYNRAYQSYRLAMSKPKSWVWHWRYGFVKGVAKALEEAKAQARQEAGDDWALVVLHEEDLDNYVTEKFAPKKVKSKVDTEVSAAQGFEAGRRMNMQRQIRNEGTHESTELALPG